jgi:chromosome segregation ATPase
LIPFQSAKEKQQLEEIIKEKDSLKVDFEKTLQQLTDLKADMAEIKAQKDILVSEKEALNEQLKVCKLKFIFENLLEELILFVKSMHTCINIDFSM